MHTVHAELEVQSSCISKDRGKDVVGKQGRAVLWQSAELHPQGRGDQWWREKAIDQECQ